MNEGSLKCDLSVESLVGQVADEFLRRQRQGEQPDVEEYLQRYPQAAHVLGSVLASLRLLDLSQPDKIGSRTADASTELGGVLGDFRILREVGKGGMGVVYEAEQLSLRRRVALKVLPFAATMDPRHLQRFRNETQAAACLHHTNIVPVYFVGCERGIHFYAMQFIDGQPLSDLIRQLRHAEKKTTPAAPEPTISYQPPDRAIPANPSTRAVADDTLLTSGGRRGREYYRKVAELGLQTAEALEHAHQLGIVHRDIKPANLLLDSRGNVWVTDFGLAHMQHGEASLTMTGDLVGTLRYMSPEQALAKRVVIDHRTDIYSLGVTLYELLALRPAFGGEAREELLRQVAFEEPVRPRRLDRAIPRELETIVLKSMEKNPAERYATAQELADDLRRYLNDQPIRARRPSLIQVSRKWARRHRPAVRAAFMLLVVLLVLGALNALWWMKKRTIAETEVREALHETNRWQREEKWPEALSAVRRAQGILRGFGSDVGFRQRLGELEKDVEMAQRLEAVRLLGMVGKDGHLDAEDCIAAYREAFASFGLNVEHGDISAVASFIFSRSIHKQLLAALDHWAGLQRSREGNAWMRLLAVSRAADGDTRRNRLRDAWERQGVQALDDFLASAEASSGPRTPSNLLAAAEASSEQSTMLALAGSPLAFHRADAVKRVEIILRKEQQRRPADFWITHMLAFLLHHAQPPRLEEAIGYYRTAVALHPQSPGMHVNLGLALRDNGRLDEAIAEYREAIRLKDDFAEAYFHLGNAYIEQGNSAKAFDEAYQKGFRRKKDYLAPPDVARDGAIAEFRQVIFTELLFNYLFDEHGEIIFIEVSRLNDSAGPRLFELRRRGNQLDEAQLEEAITKCRETIPIKKELALKHFNLGNALRGKGRLDEAICVYLLAIEFNGEWAHAHHFLGECLSKKGRPDEAIAEYRNAVRVMMEAEDHISRGNTLTGKWTQMPKRTAIGRRMWRVHNDLGIALYGQGRFKEAEAEYREAIDLKPGDPVLHCNLGNALHNQSRDQDAETEYRIALEHKPDSAYARGQLANFLNQQGRHKEAEAQYRELIRLQPGDPEIYDHLGTYLAGLGQWEKASAEFVKATECKTQYANAWYHRGMLCLRARDLDSYRKVCADMLQRFGKADDPDSARWLAWTCVLVPDAVDDSAQLVQLAEKAVKKEPMNLQACCTLGAALYRSGRFEDAAKQLTVASTLKPNEQQTAMAYTWYFLAMTHHRLGHADEARRWLEKATQATEAVLKPPAGPAEKPTNPTDAITRIWNRKLTLQLLRREAEGQIQGQQGKLKSNSPERRPDAAPKKTDKK